MSAMRNSIRRAKDGRGFTLIELTIILLVLVILSMIMLPQMGNFNRLARFVKVTEDLVVLCSQMKKMLDETFENAFWMDPQIKAVPVGTLFTEGDNAALGANLNAGGTDQNWLQWSYPVSVDS